MKKELAVRICIDKDEDIVSLNQYLDEGYKIVDRTEITPRLYTKKEDGGIYYAAMIIFLEKDE